MNKLIIGLGNPCEKYQNNRHNVGFMFVDFLSQKSKVTSQKLSEKFKSEILEVQYNQKDLILLKPQTFMNESGKPVSLYIRYSIFKIPDLLVVHDDLDLKLGEYKINLGKGPKIHYGINSIEEALGTKDFWRLRIGVDNRNSENRTPGEAYVLQNFLPEEKEKLEAVFSKVLEDLRDKI